MIKRLTYYYPDFPIGVEATVSEVIEPIENAILNRSRTFQYYYARPGIRAIANNRPQPNWYEKEVSYDQNAAIVGESVHISAIERLGREAPIGDCKELPQIGRNTY
jgi:hypothetical protein